MKYKRGDIKVSQQLLTGHIWVLRKRRLGWQRLAIIPNTLNGPDLAWNIKELWDRTGYPYYTDSTI